MNSRGDQNVDEGKQGFHQAFPEPGASFLRRGRKDAGYTLLELLVVMGILAVLTAVATPQLMAYFGKAKTQTAQLQIENIGTASNSITWRTAPIRAPASGSRPWSRPRRKRHDGTVPISRRPRTCWIPGAAVPIQLSRFGWAV